VIKAIREKERAKYIRMLQRSILLCPQLTINSKWTELRPLVAHTEGYAVLPEEDCKLAFETLMKRLREGRPAIRQVRRYEPRTIALPDYYGRKLAQRVNAADGKVRGFRVPKKEQGKARRALEAKHEEEKELMRQRAKEARIPRRHVKRLRMPPKVTFPKRKVIV
jgi:hypothetical protein